jgi:hypothetical protein
MLEALDHDCQKFKVGKMWITLKNRNVLWTNDKTSETIQGSFAFLPKFLWQKYIITFSSLNMAHTHSRVRKPF